MTILHAIDPLALELPFWPHGIHWYGLMYGLAFLSAWWLGRRRVRAGRLPGVNEDGFGDLLFYGMLGVVIGGRVGYVLFYGFEAFLADPLMLLRINEGGMSFHGGLLGVLVAAAWWTRRQRLHFFDTVDFLANNTLLPLGGMLIALFVGWVLPKSTVVGQLGFDGGRYTLWQLLSRFVAPAGVLVVFIYTVISTI